MKKITVKKSMTALCSILSCAVLMTACGGASKDTAAIYMAETTAGAAVNESYSYNGEMADMAFDSAPAQEAVEEESAASGSAGSEKEGGLDSKQIKKEMLVYRCNIEVDVLDFDKALASFKNRLDSCGGFIESENFNDGSNSGRWYIEDAEKWRYYYATVRVPSDRYDEFCSSTSELGDVRTKSANVENVSAEYYDLSATLDIYEAKEQRYIKLLETITEDEYAVTVERELTDIQTEIARIKTRMNTISTDVAYSYVNVTLNEVRQYVAEPVPEDTFGQRLSKTITETGEDFLIFLEDLLFWIISVFPYAVIIGIPVVIIVKVCRAKKAKKRRAIEEAKAQAAADPIITENKE